MHLSPTARVILGMLGFRPMSGYEIKALVDNSTRFFWAASYGQIYPELRRLAEAGLIEGDPQAQGGRRRTVFSLTATGRDALVDWHHSAPEIQETRDETMLKLFFADAVGGGATRQALEGKRDHHRDLAARLREIQAGKDPDTPSSAMRTLRLGIEWNEWAAGWCERELEQLPNPERKRTRT